MHDELAPAAPLSPSPASTSLIEAFTLRANLLGAEVLVTDRSSLYEVVCRAVGELGGPVAVSSDLGEHFPYLKSLDTRDEGPWLTAITRARLGVASTASVLIAESNTTDALLPLLARTHIVIVLGAAIVQSMTETTACLRSLAAENYRYSTFVSGPSRTSDIEKVLTLGAHGPQSLFITIVEDWNP